MSSARGFTLIELLIAIAISAILAVGTLFLVQASRTTYQTLTVSNEYQSQLTRVIRTLTNDFTQWAPDRPVKDAFGDNQAAMHLDEVDGLSLTRNGWGLSQFVDLERSSLQRVQYRLAVPGSELCPWLDEEAENDKGGCLVRSHTLQLDDDGSLEWRHQTLLRPVKTMSFSFMARYDGETGEFDKWPPDVPFGQEGEPDLFAVEFTLTTGEGDAITRMVAVPRNPDPTTTGGNSGSNEESGGSGAD
ncbi:type II secretion system protein GspJ [Saccharospirillum salsuginis]|nr:type II secretion system protein GspJ [Saccharospirillum salsuginis]